MGPQGEDGRVTELHELDAHDQAALLRAGRASSVELVAHHLERVESIGPQLGAFVTVTPDAALARARQADERLASGDGIPPFLGVPTAFKDLTLHTGVTTTIGSTILQTFVPPL